MDRHRLAELTSLELHRAVADRLREQPEALERARARVRGWLAEGGAHRAYAERWHALLEAPLDELCETLVADTEEARALRQVSPFAGALGPRERWHIWRAVRRRVAESA